MILYMILICMGNNYKNTIIYIHIDPSDKEQPSNKDQPDLGELSLHNNIAVLGYSVSGQTFTVRNKQFYYTGSPQRYAMKNRQALIINIVEHSKGERRGSDKDIDALEETLNMLGYTVHVETDLEHNQITSKVVEHAEKDKCCDSFICCILAHGNQGVVCGSDKIKEISKSLNEVTQLRGNPKIFFFQACQGTDTQETLAEVDDGSSTSSAKQSSATRPIEIDVAIPKLPRDSDFFYGYASSAKGSLYIQALCRVLKRKYREEDLLTMVTGAHYLVAKDEQSLKKGGKDVSYQQPQFMSTLRKLVHF